MKKILIPVIGLVFTVLSCTKDKTPVIKDRPTAESETIPGYAVDPLRVKGNIKKGVITIVLEQGAIILEKNTNITLRVYSVSSDTLGTSVAQNTAPVEFAKENPKLTVPVQGVVINGKRLSKRIQESIKDFTNRYVVLALDDFSKPSGKTLPPAGNPTVLALVGEVVDGKTISFKVLTKVRTNIGWTGPNVLHTISEPAKRLFAQMDGFGNAIVVSVHTNLNGLATRASANVYNALSNTWEATRRILDNGETVINDARVFMSNTNGKTAIAFTTRNGLTLILFNPLTSGKDRWRTLTHSELGKPIFGLTVDRSDSHVQIVGDKLENDNNNVVDVTSFRLAFGGTLDTQTDISNSSKVTGGAMVNLTTQNTDLDSDMLALAVEDGNLGIYVQPNPGGQKPKWVQRGNLTDANTTLVRSEGVIFATNGTFLILSQHEEPETTNAILRLHSFLGTRGGNHLTLDSSNFGNNNSGDTGVMGPHFIKSIGSEFMGVWKDKSTGFAYSRTENSVSLLGNNQNTNFKVPGQPQNVREIHFEAGTKLGILGVQGNGVDGPSSTPSFRTPSVAIFNSGNWSSFESPFNRQKFEADSEILAPMVDIANSGFAIIAISGEETDIAVRAAIRR